MAQAIETGMERFGQWWCRVMHNAPTWPIHSEYGCRTCGRRHAVPWRMEEPCDRFHPAIAR